MYINRDLSWMEFNERIIQQVTLDIPLMEKVNMLSISASNLDEFIMVRLSKLMFKAESDPFESDFDEIRYKDLLKTLKKKVKNYKKLQLEVYNYLLGELAKEGINIINHESLNKEDKIVANKIYHKKIEPLLIVNYLDINSFRDSVRSKKVYIIIQTKNDMYYIEIPDFYNSLYKINKSKYIRIEDLIISNIESLMENEEIKSVCAVRFLRSTHYNFPFCDENKMDEEVEAMLSQREISAVISYEVSDTKGDREGIDAALDTIVYSDDFIYDMKGYLNLISLNTLKLSDDLYYPSKKPREYDIFKSMSMLDVLDSEGSVLLHHPYDSYDPVIKLIDDASKDKDVIIISQTLYRVSSIDSPIIDALCRASLQYRKQVNVLIELKARFDEGRNLEIRKKLKAAGCNVMYSKSSIKIHAKCMSIIKMDEDEGLKYYTHIGTGNYNEKSAKLYTDLSYMTKSNKIGRDVFNLFKNMEIKSNRGMKMKRLILSPTSMRDFILENIRNEINNARKGKPANILIKVNSLSDEEIIDALYRASEAGVKVQLIVRGICSINKINDNIEIKSVIGRYLEHSRIYYFYNNGNDVVGISSADVLRRNLDRRVEILLPIKDKKIKQQIVGILSVYWNDKVNSYYKDKEGKWIKDEFDRKNSVNAHELCYKL